MNARPPALLTARLALRRFTPDDAPFAFALLNSPGWLRYIGDRGIRTDDDARRYLADGPIASYAAHGYGGYLVTRRGDGDAIGLCGLIRRDPAQPEVELGFAFLPAHHGRGYATEAGAAVLAEARALGLSRVHAIAQTDNTASARVLAKLGFVPLRHLPATGNGVPLQLFAVELAGPAAG